MTATLPPAIVPEQLHDPFYLVQGFPQILRVEEKVSPKRKVGDTHFSFRHFPRFLTYYITYQGLCKTPGFPIGRRNGILLLACNVLFASIFSYTCYKKSALAPSVDALCLCPIYFSKENIGSLRLSAANLASGSCLKGENRIYGSAACRRRKI